MQGLVSVAAASLAGPAHAGVAEDLLKAQLRPEVDTIDAVVKLLDARGALVAIKVRRGRVSAHRCRWGGGDGSCTGGEAAHVSAFTLLPHPGDC